MTDNIRNFPRQEEPKMPPNFKYQVELNSGVPGVTKSLVFEGFLTVMGDFYFIGRGLPDGEVTWVFSAPKEAVVSVYRIDGQILTHDA
jgi:hypothetical protein